MVDIKWRAVAIGFVVIAVLSALSGTVEGLGLLGGVFAGLLGGWLTGYYADTGRRNGAWNGFFAGSIGALVSTGILVALGLAVSVVTFSLAGVLTSIGFGVAVFTLIFVGAVPATVGGYLGGMYPRSDVEETETGRSAA
jgi:hypothetical protein